MNGHSFSRIFWNQIGDIFIGYEDMKETLEYGGLTTFEIREACSTIEFYELENVHKGDTIFECYKCC